MSGICVDALNPAGCPTADELRAAGADGVRLVAFADYRFVGYANELDDAGLTVAVVIARESCADDDFGGWASYYAERVWPTYWVLGNEMDAYLLPAESPSSWTMRPAEYGAFWRVTAGAIRARQASASLIVGGLVSGQPWWASGVKPLLVPAPDGWDIHPYGKDASETAALLHLYQEALE